jgi:methionine salvage enolase-phosphatase E1
MKRNVVTRETARKLKAAGFPGVTMWHYSEGMVPPDKLFFTQSSGFMQFDIVAPTAQEIADQLPGFWSMVNSKVTSTYHAAYHGDRDIVNADADTMAEALALLWLKLRKAEN